ncbi:MAG: alpha-glucosidase [Clostridia bacterium]|nr:alpha-glucosidase [Oscillospiraceae bacterium]MBQ7005087.1 alpha-glucosidase [Clostridia bacterium]
MADIIVTKDTQLGEIMKTPAGHDIIMKALYSVGVSGDAVKKGPLSKLTLGKLQKLTGGKIDDSFINSLLGILNIEKDVPLTDDCEIEKKWWKEAVFYQIYPRSFKDSNGDGIGDIRGIIEKLDYLKELGVDAIWFSPMYDSPNDDNGYDIRDYEKIMEEFGTMEDFNDLVEGLHKRDMKVIMDLVINHSSDEHEWFSSSVSDPDSPYKDYYIWRDGDENTPPNNWDSIFSGSAWNYYPERKQWALHLFSKKQMDFNWENESLRKDLYAMINRWLDKGVDGFRLDVISFISKVDGLPDGDETVGALMGTKGVEHYFYGPRLHKYLHEMAENTFNKYDAFTVGECQGTGIEMSKLMTGDYRKELSVVFSFDHVENPGKKRFSKYKYDLRPMAKELVNWQLNYGNHCWPTVFFENHDTTRMTSKVCPEGYYRNEVSKLLGLMQMTMKGCPFVYQGQEIGMCNGSFTDMSQIRDVESLNYYRENIAKGKKAEKLREAIFAGTRDNGRTPMCWTKGENAGFTTGTPWLKLIDECDRINVEAQDKDPFSVLNFYRDVIRLRHENSALVYGKFRLVNEKWKDVLTYYRIGEEGTFYIELNLTDKLQKKPLSTDCFEKLLSNISTSRQNELVPYEASIYKVN